jgi:hypothetical protein
MPKYQEMCNQCTVENNKAQWAKYPDMMEICKLCESFQNALYEAIEKQQSILDRMSQIGKE